jgi:hypothetical protein
MNSSTERSYDPDNQTGANVHSNVRMTVQEAASALDITVEAVRGRMHRGKYGREKTEDGRVFVILSPDQLANGRERSDHSEPHVRPESSDQSEERSGEQATNVREQSPETPPERAELVEELRDHVAFLRGELEARNEEIRRREEEHREEARRKDTIIAQLTQRIPELPSGSPQESPEAPETASEEADRVNAPAETQEPSQRGSSWWRRFFGFE